MQRFRQVTIVGLGLIGGSLGMAIRRRRLATTVVGLSRKSSTLRRAKQRGAVDAGTTDARRAVQHANLVVLATPVDRMVPTALRLARWMRPGSVLTDVGSTKVSIVRVLERRLRRHVAFVGAHPLAGSEQRGIEAANARLFDAAICVLTPTPRTDPRSLQRVKRLWQGVGCRVVMVSPREHDRVLALTSHLPHVLAYCLAHAVDAGSLLPRLPRSFLEMTRVAKSDPALWDDVLLSNRELLQAMHRFDRQWRAVRTLLARRNRPALRRWLATAQSKRDALQDD